jgi:cytochrome b561
MHSTMSVRYISVAIALHWAIAVFIVFNLSLGFLMADFPKPLKHGQAELERMRLGRLR